MPRRCFLIALTTLALALVSISVPAVEDDANDTEMIRDCGRLEGAWKTDLGAVVRFDAIDAKTGRIEGSYQPASLPSRRFPLVGFVNANTEKGRDTGHYAVAVSFTVSFAEFGGITSWNGVCLEDEGLRLETEDLIIQPNADAAWAHVIDNHDTLIPWNDREGT